MNIAIITKTIITQSNTFNLENESDYTLVNIFIDTGNFESPYNY